MKPNFTKNKSIILTLAQTDLKVQYKSSILGIFWSFLEPLFILLVLFVVFSTILKQDIPNYPIFLLLGIIQFRMFSRGTITGIESLLARTGVISSIKISKGIFPFSANLTSFYMMCLEFVILFIFMVVLGFVPPITIIFLPILLVILFSLSFGLSLPLSVLNVHYRDIRSIWTIVVQAAFFLTPIFYKLEFLPEQVQQVVQFSPLTQIVVMSHQVVLENQLPDPFWFSYLVFSVLAIFLVGLYIHKKFSVNLVEKL